MLILFSVKSRRFFRWTEPLPGPTGAGIRLAEHRIGPRRACQPSVFVDIKLPRTRDLSVSIALIIPVYTSTTWIRRSTN